ncbi:MAG: hypothetical protein NTV34_02915, partial [Proteobacteria bacterium]|nr:hypothetical protein [Pseudomonadota bacterium]
AMETGFSKNDLSVTVSMPSNRDLKQFAELGLHLNLDSKSAIRRWAETPGASKNIGLRIDPAVAIGYGDNAKLSYGNSKFGVGLDKVLETAQFAEQLGFTIDTIHMHAGWGLQQKVSGVFEEILAQIADLVGRIKSVKVVNVGGGLCWKQTSADQPLLLDSWSILLKKHIAPLGVTIFCESGTYVVASSGILVAEVNTVEERLKQNWIGIDAGHNVNVYAAHYGIPQEIIHVQNPLGEKEHDYVVAGNINESNDIFNRGTRLPKVLEGQHIALFPTGAYGASMASDHCMKGLPKEHLVE